MTPLRGLSLFVVAAATILAAGPAGAQSPDAAVAVAEACDSRTDVLGVERVVEIDATGGPRYGHGQYKENTFLNDGEVVLTFDDGPLRRTTLPILDALDAQCTRATFFSVGRMAVADPETLQETARRGHTIATHTWSHRNLRTSSAAKAKDEIELGVSAVSAALGRPVAPFFRFPYLADSKAAQAHLGERNIAAFSIEVDSKDYRTRNPGTVLRNVLAQLTKEKKGILLFHDIQPSTAGALATLLSELKERGFKVVHLVAKEPVVTLPEYDAIAEKELDRRKLALATRPMAERAMNWPATGAGDAASEKSKASTGVKSARKAHRVPKLSGWGTLVDEPWQLKSFIGE